MFKVGQEVTSYKSQCIGTIIESWRYTGVVTKVNEKSIWVAMVSMDHKRGHTEYSKTNCSGTVKFNYWKTAESGRTFYKSDLNGILEAGC